LSEQCCRITPKKEGTERQNDDFSIIMHESFDATIPRRADGGQRGEVAPLRREGCRESVLGCLPRGNRAGGDLGDCSQYNARAGRPGIYDALHARLSPVTQSLPLPLRVASLPVPVWWARSAMASSTLLRRASAGVVEEALRWP